MTREEILRAGEEFHKLYYGPHDALLRLNNTSWLGVSVQKCPFDLFVLQEIICDVRPSRIIETGTASGGSALFMASVCELLGRGRVLTIDKQNCRIQHPRIDCYCGYSVAQETVNFAKRLCHGCTTVMVVLDSNHGKEHVRREMELYGELVTKGSYMIVEDTNINGHPVSPDSGPGPWEAVEEYLTETSDFVVDAEREHYLFTCNPNGYLKRVK